MLLQKCNRYSCIKTETIHNCTITACEGGGGILKQISISDWAYRTPCLQRYTMNSPQVHPWKQEPKLKQQYKHSLGLICTKGSFVEIVGRFRLTDWYFQPTENKRKRWKTRNLSLLFRYLMFFSRNFFWWLRLSVEVSMLDCVHTKKKKTQTRPAEDLCLTHVSLMVWVGMNSKAELPDLSSDRCKVFHHIRAENASVMLVEDDRR